MMPHSMHHPGFNKVFSEVPLEIDGFSGLGGERQNRGTSPSLIELTSDIRLLSRLTPTIPVLRYGADSLYVKGTRSR